MEASPPLRLERDTARTVGRGQLMVLEQKGRTCVVIVASIGERCGTIRRFAKPREGWLRTTTTSSRLLNRLHRPEQLEGHPRSQEGFRFCVVSCWWRRRNFFEAARFKFRVHSRSGHRRPGREQLKLIMSLFLRCGFFELASVSWRPPTEPPRAPRVQVCAFALLRLHLCLKHRKQPLPMIPVLLHSQWSLACSALFAGTVAGPRGCGEHEATSPARRR